MSVHSNQPTKSHQNLIQSKEFPLISTETHTQKSWYCNNPFHLLFLLNFISQKYSSNCNTQNHQNLYAVFHVKEVKPKSTLKVKAVVGIVLIAPRIRYVVFVSSFASTFPVFSFWIRYGILTMKHNAWHVEWGLYLTAWKNSAKTSRKATYVRNPLGL